MEQAKDRSDRLSEADTKAAFIERILSALGWDLRDVFSVSREYRHKPQDNPVDYSLFVGRRGAMENPHGSRGGQVYRLDAGSERPAWAPVGYFGIGP